MIDDVVFEGYKGFYGFFYGEGGVEVYGFVVMEFKGCEGEDDGNVIFFFEIYILFCESFKYVGVFVIFNL